jgi:mannosylglycerate hydrolase
MEQAFGTVERSLTLEPPSPFEHAIGTVPQKTFTCIQDGALGVAIFNRGIPEVEVRRSDAGTDIALTLIRAVGWLSRSDLRFRHGPAGPGLETPDAQSRGLHRFAYALTTYAGDWSSAGILTHAHAFAYAPLAVITDAHAGALCANAPLVHSDNPHIVLSALAASQRRSTFVARWYNSSADAQPANVDVPLATRVRPVNFLARPSRAVVRRVGPQRWRIRFRPFEIVTLEIRTG